MAIRAGNVIRNIVITFFSIFILAPIMWMILTSVKYFRDIITSKILFSPTLYNYHTLFTENKQFLILFRNSLIISFFAMLVCVFVGSLGAYGLSRFKWKRIVPHVLLGWVVVIQTIPSITIALPLYFLASKLNLLDTKLMMVLTYSLINLPFVLWLMISSFQQIPLEIEEAAKIDGASAWQTFFQVLLPLSKTILVTGALFTFIFSWNEFLMALNLTSTPNAMTLTVGISGFIQSYDIQYGNMAAASTLGALPGILLAVFAQRYIVSGITAGSVKC
jgi:multiple sugar transport system permease protein